MPTPAQTDIRSLYQQAMAAQARGALAEARGGYQHVLRIHPDLAEALFQLARIDMVEGNTDAALEHLDAALVAKPAEPAIWQEVARALVQSGNPADIDAWTLRAEALGIDPAARAAFRTGLQALADPLLQARVLLAAGQGAAAEKLLRTRLKTAPGNSATHGWLARALAAQGQMDRARRACATAVRLAAPGSPDAALAQVATAQVLARLGDNDAGLAHARRALKTCPDLADGWTALAVVLARLHDLPGAIRASRKGLQLSPGDPEARPLLGEFLLREKDFSGAEGIFAGLAARPDAPLDHLLHLAAAQEGRSATEAALATYDRALSQHPDSAAAHDRKAVLLQTHGDFAAAEGHFQQALRLDPRNGDIYRRFAAGQKLSPEDPLVARMQALFDDASLPRADRAQLGFALAKVMEDARHHARVFGYLDRANRDMRKLVPYDIADRRAEMAAQADAFATARPGIPPPAGATDFAPIFITGLPRSGTTLIERIVSSHPRVTGIGEAGFAAREAHRLLVRRDGTGLRPLAEIPPDEIAALGHAYADLVCGIAPDAVQVADKSIQTYAYLPLLRLALPRARFIVVRRDPRDTLLSIYKNVFPPGTHGYAYDLRDLAEYYHLFARRIDSLRSQLPGTFSEFRYEDLIAAPEDATRALIADCGLPWDDACLSHMGNSGSVRTLSVFQARQPIYASSVAAWQRYETELAPLLRALEGDAP